MLNYLLSDILFLIADHLSFESVIALCLSNSNIQQRLNNYVCSECIEIEESMGLMARLLRYVPFINHQFKPWPSSFMLKHMNNVDLTQCFDTMTINHVLNSSSIKSAKISMKTNIDISNISHLECLKIIFDCSIIPSLDRLNDYDYGHVATILCEQYVHDIFSLPCSHLKHVMIRFTRNGGHVNYLPSHITKLELLNCYCDALPDQLIELICNYDAFLFSKVIPSHLQYLTLIDIRGRRYHFQVLHNVEYMKRYPEVWIMVDQHDMHYEYDYPHATLYQDGEFQYFEFPSRDKLFVKYNS